MSSGSFRFGTGVVKLGVKDDISKGLNRAAIKLRAFGRIASSVGATVSSVGKRLAAVSLVPAAGLAFAVKKFADFQDQILTLQGVAKQGSLSFDLLQAKIRELGAATSFTAAEVAGASIALARAGFDTTEIDASIESILNLARATGTELPEAAGIAADVIRGFGIATADSARVIDVLVATANGSSQTLQDLFENLKIIGPVAADAGLSLEQAAAAAGILANAGIKGSLGATALRRALENVLDPKIQAQLSGLGVEFQDTAGNLRSITDILGDLFAAVSSAPSAERLQVLFSVLGARGILAQQIGRNIKDFKAFSESLDNAGGIAARVAKKIDSGTGGALRRLSSAVEGFLITVGEALAGPLTGMIEWLANLTQKVGEYLSRNEEAVIGIAKLVAGALALGAGLALLGPLIGGVVSATATVGAAMVAATATVIGFTASIAGLALSLGPVGVLLAVVLPGAVLKLAGLLTGALVSAIDGVRGAFSSLTAHAKDQFAEMAALFKGGDFEAAIKILVAQIERAFAQVAAKIEALVIKIRAFAQAANEPPKQLPGHLWGTRAPTVKERLEEIQGRSREIAEARMAELQAETERRLASLDAEIQRVREQAAAAAADRQRGKERDTELRDALRNKPARGAKPPLEPLAQVKPRPRPPVEYVPNIKDLLDQLKDSVAPVFGALQRIVQEGGAAVHNKTETLFSGRGVRQLVGQTPQNLILKQAQAQTDLQTQMRDALQAMLRQGGNTIDFN